MRSRISDGMRMKKVKGLRFKKTNHHGSAAMRQQDKTCRASCNYSVWRHFAFQPFKKSREGQES